MIKVTLQRNLIGLEDLLVGTGTVTQVRGPASSAPVTITRINGANLPYDGTYSMQQKFDLLQGQIDSLPEVVDGDGNLLTGLIDSSSSDIGATHTNRLWRRTISSTEARIYWGTQIVVKYNPTTNEIILPANTDYVAADAVVTAAFEAADAAIISDYEAADAALTTAFEAADSDLQDQIDDLVTDVAALGVIPIGAITWVPYSTPDTNWKECNGQALSRSTYSALFAKVGTTYGAGDGSTTFNIPDLRGEFVRGFDNGRGIDSGRAIGTAQAGALESHSHAAGTLATASAGAHTHTVPVGGSDGSDARAQDANTEGTTITTSSSGAHTHTITGSTAASGAAETRPRNIALMAQIRVL